MQIAQFVRIRNVSIVVTIVCAFIIFACHRIDTNSNDVNALRNYMEYSRSCVEGGDSSSFAPESCSVILRDDSIFKSNPDHVKTTSYNTVEELEEFVDGWSYADTHYVNPYVKAYIKQSLWEYADWCINEESDDYWHMKYVASQKTGVYSYTRQITYKWYKLIYEKSPFIVMASLFTFVFVNVLCIIYGLNGSTGKVTPIKKMPRWTNDCSDGKE